MFSRGCPLTFPSLYQKMGGGIELASLKICFTSKNVILYGSIENVGY